MIPAIAQYGSIAEARRVLQRGNKAFGKDFVVIPTTRKHPSPGFVRAMRNRDFCVQIFTQETPDFGSVTRLSINRANIDREGRWTGGITWDELQGIKRACGYGEALAVEIYPEDRHLVDDANMRHLFVVSTRPSFAWTEANRS